MDLITATVLILIIGTIIFSVLSNKQTTPKAPVKPSPNVTPANPPSQEPETATEPLIEQSPPKIAEKPDTKVESPKEIEKPNEIVKEEPTPIVEPAPTKAPEPEQTTGQQNHYKKVIIFGPSHSKKTEFFYKLLLANSSLDFKTETSIQVNESMSFKLAGKGSTLVDIPGHSNFDNKIASHLQKGSLLLFTVSPWSETAKISQMAHKFYNLVTQNNLEKAGVKLAMAVIIDRSGFNEDLGADFLEDFKKEIERIKFSRRTHVNSEESGEGDYLKEIKENFDFGHVRCQGWNLGFVDISEPDLATFVAGL